MRARFLPILILATVSLGACSWMPKLKFWGDNFKFPQTTIKVRELRRALLCGTPTEEPVLRLFDSAEQLLAWDTENHLALDRLELPEDRSFVLLEQGLRRTSGYSVELARTAKVSKEGTLSLSAEWLAPGEDRMVAQMLTSLCVLAAVDAMPYRRVEVLDASGALKAETMPER